MNHAIWYHGSPERFSVLRQGSTVTPFRALAKAFSHKPSLLCQEDNGTICHNGARPGFLYQIAEPAALGQELLPHPGSTLEPGSEFLTQRPLGVRLTGVAPWPHGPLIRLASLEDARELARLNRLFNGPPGASEDMVRRSLKENPREIVVVAEPAWAATSRLSGFICLQLKYSFCYQLPIAEVTEVFVEEDSRRQGLAGAMLRFGEEYAHTNFQAEEFSLLTGEDNFPAQNLYKSLGYARENEVMFAKPIE